jgi:hypothetical protein
MFLYITHTAIIVRTKNIPKNKNVDEDFFKAIIIYLYKFIFKGSYERPEKYVAKNKTRKVKNYL